MPRKFTKAILIDLNNSAYTQLIPNTDVEGKGITLEKEPYAQIKDAVVREVHSQTVPALLVTHVLRDVRWGSETPLSILKFYLSRFKPRGATEENVRAAIEEAARHRNMTVSPEALDADVKYLMTVPSDDAIEAAITRIPSAENQAA